MVFSYYFTVDHVHDGDTVYGVLDMGLSHYLGREGNALYGVRFYGINCPELSNPDGTGAQCRDYLETLVVPGQVLAIDSHSWDKYAMRFDGVPFTLNADGSRNVNLCQAMLDFGHGTVVMK